MIFKKVALITGAANGLGLALAKRCLAKSMIVMMLDRDQDALTQQTALLDSADVYAFFVDVKDSTTLSTIAAKILEIQGRIDLIFNNAAISGSLAPLWEQSPTTIQEVMNINLFGVINCINAFMPFLFQQPHRSHIINIGSMYSVCSSALVGAYAMSKHALLALTESIHFDLQRLNKPVDISIACPAFINTGLLKKNTDEPHSRMAYFIEQASSADDIAEAIMKGLDNREFYIFPQQEVKEYGKQRIENILAQSPPPKQRLEKLLCSFVDKK